LSSTRCARGPSPMLITGETMITPSEPPTSESSYSRCRRSRPKGALWLRTLIPSARRRPKAVRMIAKTAIRRSGAGHPLVDRKMNVVFQRPQPAPPARPKGDRDNENNETKTTGSRQCTIAAEGRWLPPPAARRQAAEAVYARRHVSNQGSQGNSHGRVDHRPAQHRRQDQSAARRLDSAAGEGGNTQGHPHIRCRSVLGARVRRVANRGTHQPAAFQ